VVDYLVQKGVPFRNAHHIIGALVALAEEKSMPLNELSLQDVQGVDEHFEADWVDCFDVVKALESREKIGMPGPNEVKSQIARLRRKLG
jgi:argininosuccinate lyase